MNKNLLESYNKLKQTQAQLIQQEKLASIGQLAAGVAHEINNPLGFISSNFKSLQDYLTIIKGYILALENLVQQVKRNNSSNLMESIIKIEELKEKKDVNFILHDIEDIFSESVEGFDRMMSIVENLKNFSRIDCDNNTEEYDINKAIESTLIVARNEIKYVAQVEKHLSEVPLIECRGDEINQVILNILVNAAQAIKAQNRSELGKIEIKSYQKGEHVYCEICDDGPGIPNKIFNKIFDPFFTTKEVGKGTGLGLNISYDIIVNKHKGDLIVNSEVGKGATFIIKLPITSLS